MWKIAWLKNKTSLYSTRLFGQLKFIKVQNATLIKRYFVSLQPEKSYKQIKYVKMRTLFYLLLGFSLGMVVALLFAPSSGKKTRKRLSKQMKKMQLELEAQTEKSMDALNDWKTSVEELAENAAKKVNSNGSMSSVADA